MVLLLADGGGAVFIALPGGAFIELFSGGRRFARGLGVGVAQRFLWPSERAPACRQPVFSAAGGRIVAASPADGACVPRFQRFGGVDFCDIGAHRLGVPRLGGGLGAGAGGGGVGVGFAARRALAGRGGADAVYRAGIVGAFARRGGLSRFARGERPARPAQPFGALFDVGRARCGLFVVAAAAARLAGLLGGVGAHSGAGAREFAHYLYLCAGRCAAAAAVALACRCIGAAHGVDYGVCAVDDGADAVCAQCRFGLVYGCAIRYGFRSRGSQRLCHVGARYRMAQGLANLFGRTVVGARLGQLCFAGLFNPSVSTAGV